MKRVKKTQKKLDADTNQKQNQIFLTNKKSNHQKASFASLLALKTYLFFRLKLLEKKKTEMALKSRKEIADYIAAGKPERAKIRVEHIIREDYYVEG